MTTKDKNEDSSLFRDSVKGVKRLPHDRIAPYRKRVRPQPRQRIEDEAQLREELLLTDYETAELETGPEIGDELFFARDGLQHSLLRKLRRGQHAISAELDLHGMTAAEARQALSYFLADCQAGARRCVRIIHGKGLSSPGGRPVLKTHLNSWLRRCDEVLAFCSAQRRDGGTGAVYVLLKSRQ